MDATLGYLVGHCLIAMPQMEDTRFERSVVFLCAHSADGAMGLIVNKPSDAITFPQLLSQLELINDQSIRLPEAAERITVHNGGPVEQGRGFVLHTSDYRLNEATLNAGADVCLTATVEILRAIANGKGPNSAMLALGYAGWEAGQLEREIAANGWLHCAPDHGLLFDEDDDKKYERAIGKLGITPALLSGAAGHA